MGLNLALAVATMGTTLDPAIAGLGSGAGAATGAGVGGTAGGSSLVYGMVGCCIWRHRNRQDHQASR